MSSRAQRGICASLVLLLAGCAPEATMWSRASDAAERVATFAAVMVVVGIVILLLVITLVAAAARRNRDRDPATPDLRDVGLGFVIRGGVIFPSIVLVGLFITGAAILGAYPRGDHPAATFRITGRQWWWQIEYQGELPWRFSTANELHVPVGQPVRLVLTSADVIHSFWVPQLQGKLDLIPGDTNVLTITARRAGTYTGTCAEFCGPQHANMKFLVVAEDPASFRAWLADERAPAPAPTDSVSAEGQRLFVGGPCAMCHTVRGTPALATVGPDLTHVGSRGTIAAGMLPNTQGNLEAWIANAQALKPGAQMPPIAQFNGRELRALASYLMSLR